MKSFITYVICLFWVLAPLASLKGVPIGVFLAGSPLASSGYTLVDSLTGTSTGASSPGNANLNANAYAAEFTPTTGYTIARVDLPLSKTGSPTQDYYCEIWTQVGSLPGALVGSASVAVNGADLPATETDYPFYPNATITQSGSEKYYIVLRASTNSTTDYANWHRITTSGRIDIYNISVWQNSSTTRRLKFKIYTSP